MSTETTVTPVTETPVTQEASDPGKLSFSEYETYRRTGEMPKAEVVEEKPSASAEITPAAHKEAEESETPATEDKEETKDESEGEVEETEPKDESATEEKPKKKGGFQRRIDKLNAQKTAAQQEVEYWKQLALKSAGAPNAETSAAPKATATSEPAKDGKPSPDQFEDHASYVEALTDWKVEQKLKETASKAEQAKAQTEHQTIIQSYAEKARTFAEKTDDYFDVLEAAEGVAPWSPAVQQLVLKSGPELAYAIAKNQEEYARINRLSPIDAALAVGEIKARLTSSKAPEAKPEQKKTTQAPKPLAPLGGGNASAKKTPESMSFKEYEAYRSEQMRRRRA